MNRLCIHMKAPFCTTIVSTLCWIQFFANPFVPFHRKWAVNDGNSIEAIRPSPSPLISGSCFSSHEFTHGFVYRHKTHFIYPYSFKSWAWWIDCRRAIEALSYRRKTNSTEFAFVQYHHKSKFKLNRQSLKLSRFDHLPYQKSAETHLCAIGVCKNNWITLGKRLRAAGLLSYTRGRISPLQ